MTAEALTAAAATALIITSVLAAYLYGSTTIHPTHTDDDDQEDT